MDVCDSRGKRLLPWLVAIAFFMEMLDTTILNTAVPAIAKTLGVTPLSMKSVLSSYTLSLAVFIPISSWVADRFGTRKVFAAAIAIFTLGSFLCGISKSIHLLVACRILQGCGGALMVPVGRLTLVRAFPKAELVRTLSFVTIPSLIGPMIGPLAGGLIVGLFNWRMIFFVNIPVGLLGLYLVYHYLPNFQARKSEPLDIIGLILFSSGIAIFSYVLEVFGEHTLSNPEIIGLLAISILLLGGYGLHARSIPHPLLRLELLRIRTLRIGILGNFITRLGAGGLPFLLPLFYQIGLGYHPIHSGLFIIPQSFATMVIKMTMPRILTWFGYRKVLLFNTLFTGISIFLFSTVGPETPVWIIVGQACLFGCFSSLQYTSMNTLVYADVADEDTGPANTIVSTVQQMAMSFGVATASLVASFFIPDRRNASTAEIVLGIHHALILLGGLTFLSAFGFFELRATDGENVSHHRNKNSASSKLQKAS